MSAALQQKPQEPSMEEILASIRKIIADDTAVAKVPPGPPAAPAAIPPAPPRLQPVTAPVAANEDDDILDLPASARKSSPDLLNDDPVSLDVQFADDEPALPVQVELPVAFQPPPPMPDPPVITRVTQPEPEPAPVFLPPPAVERLMSDRTDEAARIAFGSLANTMLGGQSQTIDDVVREMLKPMIRSWLDDNLPTMVERLVKAEIERVARGGR
jgi:uncharacterized protein